MSQYKYLVSSRKHVRAQITKLYDKAYAKYDEIGSIEVSAMISKVDYLETEINKFNGQISVLLFEDKGDSEEFISELESCEAYTDKIGESRSLLQSKKSQLEQPLVPLVSSESIRPNKLKLPELPLPKYSHSRGETLLSFLAAFESVVKAYNLSSYEKFIFLKRQLLGPPLTLVESLEISQQSYESAVSLLKRAFASDVSQKFDAIQRLRDLRCNNKPYEFIGEMRLIRDLFSTLKIDVDIVMQFFAWHGLSTELQTQLINICNDNKPSMKQIEDNFFKALDRVNELGSKIKNRRPEQRVDDQGGDKNVTSYATRVDVKPSDSTKFTMFCSLCSDINGTKVTSHTTRNCPKFTSAKAKCVRLETLQACTRCGLANHTASRCRHKFRETCLKCSGLHMTFLCVGDSVDSRHSSTCGPDKLNSKSNHPFKKSPNSNSHTHTGANSGGASSVSSNAAWVEFALQTRLGGEAILPTFTCLIHNYRIRGLKDSGSQTSFIERSLVDKLSLPITTPDLSVTIHGFNESKKYSTEEVEVQLTLKNSVHNLRAIVVPEIKTKLKICGLGGIVSSFRSKKYELADSDLSDSSDSIDNISFVLGSNDTHILKETQLEFGGPVPSVYSVTSEGVLLMGSSNLMLSNLSCLKDNTDPELNVDSIAQIIACDVKKQEPHPNLCDKGCTDHDIDTYTSTVVVDTELNSLDLEKATAEILESKSDEILSRETQYFDEETTEINRKLLDIVLSEMKRVEDGRIVVPLAWRANVSSALANNAELAKKILKSNERKLLANQERLLMIDEVFREQEKLGIIERIIDPSFFERNPSHSYLAHMAIFKMTRETTKCRVVFLSNLCQRHNNKVALSHNQVMHSGPSLNSKITTSLLHLRFDESLLCFDIKKAFLQLSLNEHDSNRLLFFWYRNVANKDFSLVTYRQLRLPFGLRCSPFLLMMSLFKILCVDSEGDDPRLKSLKNLIYALMYVDNGAVTGTFEDVNYAYDKLRSIFSPYQFEIQQLTSNDEYLQARIDSDENVETESDVKLLGLIWDRKLDRISTKPLKLDVEANTKRLILSSIAQQYDVYGFQAPLLVRARLFLHALQCDKSLNWDDKLPTSSYREWQNIARQANSAPAIKIHRCIGLRTGRYEIVAYTDASKYIYSTVLYLHDVDSGKISFVCAKNRIVNTQLQTKTIPSLELQAVALGVQCVVDLRNELSGNKCMFPITILSCKLFTDSMITLHWLNSYNHNLDKMQKRSVFVLNRLEYVARQCEKVPITFCYTSTNANPADCITRPCSYKQLLKTHFLTGVLTTDSNNSCPMADFQVTVPDPGILASQDVHMNIACIDNETPVISVERCSSLKKLVRITLNILKFIHNMKRGVKRRDDSKFVDFHVMTGNELYLSAYKHVLRTDQNQYFGDIFDFLRSKNRHLKDIPPLVSKLNIIIDNDGLLKIKSKFGRNISDINFTFPILLSKDSVLTSLLIRNMHEHMAHAGTYNVLTYLRKKFWISHPFTTVKKVLKTCVVCKRFNSRTVRLNQNSYRDFRSNPPCEPFRSVFIDYIGPYVVKNNNVRQKVWLLAITCLWSRYINLKVCSDMTVRIFLQAFQMHIFEHGLPALVMSDLGSQLVSGANIITDHLNSIESKSFLAENGMSSVTFEQYFKGNSSLGSLVEVCVKLTKRVIYGTIKKNILLKEDFLFIIAQAVSLLNKRPVAFREPLRDDNPDIPQPISPEMLVYGRELITPNVIPSLEADSSENWIPSASGEQGNFSTAMSRIRNVRANLVTSYNREFLQNLLDQATNVKDRYKPVSHNLLEVGDIIMLKETHMKSSDYPMARVDKIIKNDIGEVTNVIATKGKTLESVKRHVTSVIPIMRPSPSGVQLPQTQTAATVSPTVRRTQPKRTAKAHGMARTSAMLENSS